MTSVKSDNSKDIGRRLKDWGRSHYPSQKAFANALGIAESTLSNYISGDRVPGNRMQARLRALGCDVEWLMTGETREDLNKRFENMILRKARELREEDFKLLDYLRSIGVDTEEKARSVLSPEVLAHDVAMVVAERLAKYKVKKKGEKK